MSNETPEFVDGMIIKSPHENAPDFVKFKISIKRAELGNWLRGKSDEWINLDVKESREGKLYASVDNWKPDAEQAPPAQVTATVIDEDVPFADPYKNNVYCY